MKTILSLILIFVSSNVFSQETVDAEEDSIYLSSTFNILGLAQDEFTVSFELLNPKHRSIEVSLGRTWENYHFSLYEDRDTYSDFYGTYPEENFPSAKAFYLNWIVQVAVAQYFPIRKANIAPFVAAEYEFKRAFNTILPLDASFGSSGQAEGRIYNNISIYGGISRINSIFTFKLYAGITAGFRQFQYGEFTANPTNPNDFYPFDNGVSYNYTPLRKTVTAVNFEFGAKIGFGTFIKKSELM